VLAPEVFKASDSLGWIYPFWQAKRKDEVSASEVKIGADELPTVFALALGSLALQVTSSDLGVALGGSRKYDRREWSRLQCLPLAPWRHRG